MGLDLTAFPVFANQFSRGWPRGKVGGDRRYRFPFLYHVPRAEGVIIANYQRRITCDPERASGPRYNAISKRENACTSGAPVIPRHMPHTRVDGREECFDADKHSMLVSTSVLGSETDDEQNSASSVGTEGKWLASRCSGSCSPILRLRSRYPFHNAPEHGSGVRVHVTWKPEETQGLQA